jgi:hypothetical protein
MGVLVELDQSRTFPTERPERGSPELLVQPALHLRGPATRERTASGVMSHESSLTSRGIACDKGCHHD